ncbi:MAG TPA: hypothetical protein VM661_14375 [Candidatus Sulfotelmatobacter sp.]|jgi:hypothetical protein|nr:hypothetical protein [Candidatus Sulfotelmatobacter sp.]
MSISSTSLSSGLQSLDYASLYQAQNQTSTSTDGSTGDLASLVKPATVSLDASSATTAASDALQQIARPSDVSLSADGLSQLSDYMANKTSLDSTSAVQSGNSFLLKLFGGS